jgi:hypothetical protein
VRRRPFKAGTLTAICIDPVARRTIQGAARFRPGLLVRAEPVEGAEARLISHVERD